MVDESIIKLPVENEDRQDKYKYISANEKYYSSKEMYTSYNNYLSQKNSKYDLIEGLTESEISKTIDETVIKTLDKAIERYATK